MTEQHQTKAEYGPSIPPKPVPIPDEASRPFFAGAREQQLMLQHCSACGRWFWPVKTRCPACWSAQVSWSPASGRGTLYSFVLMHQLYHPAFASELPYIIAEIDLEEGVRMISTIVDCPPEQLRIGMPLEVTFEQLNAEITLPKFRPAVAAEREH
ncbi:Zn-ribbon domain-containing OB-fold protein [Thermogemmatispora sp.]|uniref:Zn-ribbon domain-containing OB-fold protein n=1 Tax=Thermogemmatispora sp. TaxID=1968838 RepID=UPI0035E46242